MKKAQLAWIAKRYKDATIEERIILNEIEMIVRDGDDIEPDAKTVAGRIEDNWDEILQATLEAVPEVVNSFYKDCVNGPRKAMKEKSNKQRITLCQN